MKNMLLSPLSVSFERIDFQARHLHARHGKRRRQLQNPLTRIESLAINLDNYVVILRYFYSPVGLRRIRCKELIE